MKIEIHRLISKSGTVAVWTIDTRNSSKGTYLHTEVLCVSHTRSHRIHSVAHTLFHTLRGGKCTAHNSSYLSRCRSSALQSPCKNLCWGSSHHTRSVDPCTQGCRCTLHTQKSLSPCCILSCSSQHQPDSYSCIGVGFQFPVYHWDPQVLSQCASYFFRKWIGLCSHWKRPGRENGVWSDLQHT